MNQVVKVLFTRLVSTLAPAGYTRTVLDIATDSRPPTSGQSP